MIDMDFETRLHDLAGGMEYPPTPEIAGHVSARLQPPQPRRLSKALIWSLTMILILFSSLILIPPARAAILEFIQIGIVRIFPRTETPTVQAPVTATAQALTPMNSTPFSPSSDLIPTLNRIAGGTSLVEAQSTASYSILLPAYPSGLGPPNRVFVQEAEGTVTVLVWTDPNNSENVILSLQFIPAGSWAIRKIEPVVLQDTEVRGQPAVWAVGPYFLELDNGDFELTRLIDGHVLIWTDGDLTMRLETGAGMEEAVRIADSLQPIP